VQVPANEFLNLEGKKISTSRNWAVWLHEYLQDMPERKDELRYVLTANMPETKDNDFIWKYDGTDNTTDSFQARVNNELVNNLGNFVNRVSVLVQKFYGGQIPTVRNSFGSAEDELVIQTGEYISSVASKLERFEYRSALQDIMKLSSAGNKYLQVSEPWKTIKENPEAAAVSLYCAASLCRALSSLLAPFLPDTSRKIAFAFGCSSEYLSWTFLTDGRYLDVSAAVSSVDLLFRKVEDTEMDMQLAKLAQPSSSANEASALPAEFSPVKQEIQIDDFSKVDIRVGRVLDVQRVPKADKLLQLSIDLGFEKRTVLSGIAEYFTPEEVKGRLICVVANLAPRKMRGIESQGMILMAQDADGKLTFVSPEPGSAPGSSIR
jgi:methionyl-tRNA synthetase